MQIIKIRNERWDITIDATEIKDSKETYKQFYTNRLDNLEKKMGKFLETHNLWGLSKEVKIKPACTCN